MRLTNDFSWSFSRRNTFQECQKKYWYTYYGSWEGWPKTPYDKRPFVEPLAAHLYALKQMQSIPTFVGTVTHNTIEHFLNGRKKFSKDELLQHGLALFEKGIDEAKNGIWQKSPKKHTNLFEYYYLQGIDDAMLASAKQKVATSLTNWHSSQIVTDLLFHPASTIVSVEALEFFHLEQVYKIIVVIDLALSWKGDTYILFDWKTGDESEKTEAQLYCYALFANKVWKVELDKIILAPFYLAKNRYYKIGRGQTEPLDSQKLKATEEGIIQSCKELYELHKRPEPEAFAYTEDRSKCQSCPFKEMCEKAAYQNITKKELQEITSFSYVKL